MNDKIPPVFYRFTQILVRLKVEWKMYNQLFHQEKNRKLFNQTGPMFWTPIELILDDHIYLSIARLMDSDKAFGRFNISIGYLATMPELVEIRPQIKAIGERLWNKHRDGLKVWRDRHISHNDLATSLRLEPLPAVPAEDVEAMIDGLWEVVEIAHRHYGGVETRKDVSVLNGVPLLLDYLQKAVDYEKEQNGGHSPLRMLSDRNLN